MKYTIDATNKTLGRVASEAAKSLIGKLLPSFEKNKIAPVSVTVINVDKLTLSDKKKASKNYVSYSLYPGGQKFLTMEQIIAKHGIAEVLRRAVFKMLPKNKLQSQRIKLLKIEK